MKDRNKSTKQKDDHSLLKNLREHLDSIEDGSQQEDLKSEDDEDTKDIDAEINK